MLSFQVKLFLYFCILFNLTDLCAQTKPVSDAVPINGMVIDSSTRVPMEFVTVILMTNKGQVTQTLFTEKDGLFSFNVTAGNYLITMSYIGYKPYTTALITVNTGKAVNLGSIHLNPQERMLEEVTIKSQKSVIQSQDDKIIYNASADIGNKAGSASDVLRKAPMVTVGADGEVKMRGSSNIKVLLNGLPSNILAKNLKEALKMIPASSIESVEVLTMPSAKYEAEGAAGVINIITKKKMKGTSGNIDLSAGNLEQSANMGLNIMKGKFNMNFSLNASAEKQRNVSQLNRQSFLERQPIGTLQQRMDALQRDKGFFREFSSEYRPDSTQKLGIGASYWYGSWPINSHLYNLYKSVQGTQEYNQTSRQNGQYGWLDFTLNYQKKFKLPGQELQFVGQVSQSADNSDYVTDQYYISGQRYFREESPNKGTSKNPSIQVDYIHPLKKSSKHLLESGIRFARSHSSSAYEVFNNKENPEGSLVKDPQRSDKMTYYQNTLAAYLSLRFELRKDWGFRLGGRYENTRLGGEFTSSSPSFTAAFDNFVPSFLITKKINDQNDLKLNYTARIRRPWIWDLNPYINASDPRNLTFGNPRLRPELTRMLEAAHTYNASTGLSLHSSIYFNSNTNAIESLTTVDSLGISRTTSQNIAANKRIGTNINASIRITNSWMLNTGAEFFHVWFKSTALNVQNNASFYSISMNTSYLLPKNFTIQVSGDYSNGYITLQGRSSANYSYRFSTRKELFNKKASLSLTINNPFQKTFLQKNFADASTFHSITTNRYYNRSITVAFSWQFGKLSSGGDYQEKNFSGPDSMPARNRRR